MCLGPCIKTNWGAEPACLCGSAPWSTSRRPAYPPPSSIAVRPPLSCTSSSWAAVDEDAVGLLNRPRAAPVGLIAGHPRKEGSRALESSLLLIVQSTHFRINAIKYGIFFFLLFSVKFLVLDISVYIFFLFKIAFVVFL